MDLLILLARASAVVLVALVSAFALRRRSAAMRSDLWRATFVALLLLPFASALLPGLAWLPAQHDAPARRGAAPPAGLAAVMPPTPVAALPTLAPFASADAPRSPASDPDRRASSPARAGGPGPGWLAALVWIWLLGAGAQALRISFGLRRAARIAGDAERTGRRGTVELARSALATTPFVWDARPFGRPVVVLPAIDGGDARWRGAVLAHELHHVEHRDGLVLPLAALVAAFYWPTPLARVALRRLRLETERAADDAALRAGARPSDYARGLVSLASAGAPLPVPTMATQATITRRVEALLDPGADRRAASRGGRRATALAVAAASVPIALLTSASAQEPPPDPSSIAAQEGARASSLERALDALVAMQDEESGAWRGDVGYKLNYDWRVTNADVAHVGATGLAVDALALASVRPGESPRGRALARGVEFLLSAQNEVGYFTSNGSRMRSHAYALRALAAVQRVAPSDRIAEALLDGVRFTIDAQSGETGGWRFVPMARESDIIETAHQYHALQLAVQQLEAWKPLALDAGLGDTARRSVQAAFRYASSAQILEPGSSQLGTFRYQPTKGARVTENTTAAGLLVTLGFTTNAEGQYDLRLWPEALAQLVALREARPAGLDDAPTHFLPWDAALLAELAFERLEALTPDQVTAAAEWRARERRWLAEHQRPDGGWDCTRGPGAAYFTAIGGLLLRD